MKIKIVYNSIIPLNGYKAIMVFRWLFVRNGERLTDVDINHESIHLEQEKEMLFVLFYIWYIAEWLVRLLLCFNPDKAYRTISFEREAYRNQYDKGYLSRRKRYAWIKYMFN